MPNISTSNKFDVLSEDTTAPGEQISYDLIQGNNKRQSSTIDEIKLQAEIVVIGDSNTRSIMPSILYPDKQVHKQPGMTIPEAIDIIETTPFSNPKCIVYHVGTNDVKQERAASGVTEKMRRLVATTHDKFPNAAIVLSSIPPRNDRHLMEIAKQVNAFIHILGQECGYISVADNDNMEENGSIKRVLFKDDGYHLNRGGVKVLAANLKEAIHPTVGLGTYNRGRRSSNAPHQRGNTSHLSSLRPEFHQISPSQRSKGVSEWLPGPKSCWEKIQGTLERL